MNQISWGTPSTGAVTKVLAVSAALAAGHVPWPAREAVSYQIERSASSYSPVIISIKTAPLTADESFSKEIASIYAKLAADQEALGSEFEAIWDANVDTLYES